MYIYVCVCVCVCVHVCGSVLVENCAKPILYSHIHRLRQTYRCVCACVCVFKTACFQGTLFVVKGSLFIQHGTSKITSVYIKLINESSVRYFFSIYLILRHSVSHSISCARCRNKIGKTWLECINIIISNNMLI